MTEKLQEEINNTPSLKLIREKRQDLVKKDIFQCETLPKEIADSPCISCENCHWKRVVINTDIKEIGYCKVSFEYVYAPRNYAEHINYVKECLTYEMSELELE